MTDIISNALGSAAAGIVSRCLTHPLDTAKARLQAIGNHHNNTYRGPLDVLRTTAKTEGIRGLYRGFGAVLVGGTPGTVLYLCSYDIFKNHLNSYSDGSSSPSEEGGGGGSFAVHFASGMLAESVACIIYVPVDVIKERMQVQTTRQGNYYRSGMDALRQIAKQEGLSGIYKGYGATLLSFGPFSALYFVFYERFKSYAMEYCHSDIVSSSTTGDHPLVLPLPWIILSSASAGALASFLTSPLDMAKLRLQIQRGNGNKGIVYKGIVDCLRQAYRQDGIIKGLFRGAGARVLHFVPATTVTMTCYESCRSFIYKSLLLDSS